MSKRKPAAPPPPPPPAQTPPQAPHPAPHRPGPHPGKSPVPINPMLYATMERTALDQTLGGVHFNVRPGDLKAVLSQDPATLDAVSLPLARIANALLPMGVLSPVQQGTYQRMMFPGLSTLVNNMSGSLRLLARNNISFPAQADHLLDLNAKRAVYGKFKLLGMQITNQGMDQRQICGALLVYLVDRTVTVLDKRFNDPKVPIAVKDKLLADFGPALMELDDVLRNPLLRKQQIGAQRDAWMQQAQDAQADAQLAETSMRLRQGLVVPRETLFAAARRYVQKQQQQPGSSVLADQPTVQVPGGPQTPRKIIG